MTKYKTIEKRPEDGYGTDRIPGGWGGEDSFEPIEPETERKVMSDMPFDEFVVKASSYAIDSQFAQRHGQAYVNYLGHVRPDLYGKMMDLPDRTRQELDPFHNDNNIPDFFYWVGVNWEKEE